MRPLSLRRALQEIWDPKILWVPEPVGPKVSERRVLEIAGLRALVSPIGSIRAGDPVRPGTFRERALPRYTLNRCVRFSSLVVPISHLICTSCL